MEENGSVIGDWMSPVPSPRTLCPGFVAEEFDSKSFSDLSVQNRSEGNLSTDLSAERNSSRGGLTERRAARSGFSAPTINMARIKALNLPSSSTDTQSPYLTIPAGISPTTLLDSPVFLSNSLAEPSPTTGTFSCTQSARTNSALDFPVPEKSEDQLLEEIGPQSSTLHPEWNLSKQMAKPTLESNATSVSNTGIKPSLTIDRHQSLPSFQNMKEFKLQAGFPELSRKISTDSITLCGRPSDPMTDSEHFHPPEDPQEEEMELRGDISSLSIGAPAEDGYNWRKYGQKQVKGSEYPRSYYKCTFPNCEVKKKVERNHAGQITEIIYKGGHNHPKPTLNRRSGVSSSHPFNDFQMNGPEETLEANPSASTAAELCENQDAVEILSTLSNEDDDDGATHESASLGYDAEEDETESKRRKLDACATDMSAGSRAVREPRVVVQTTSEIDVLDDGYRWRKYGQKVVKGNPNPRSYYKCTNPGCTVRKHVERASHDLKSVITTYEGKHNHEVPAAKSGGQASSAPSPASVVMPSASQPLDNFLRRPESAQVHESLARFDDSASLAAFSLLGRGQTGAAAMANFTLGFGQQGLAGYSSLAALPSVHSYLGHQQSANIGFAVPKGEPKEEPLLETSLPSLNGASAYYHQLMSRMPLGPQL